MADDELNAAAARLAELAAYDMKPTTNRAGWAVELGGHDVDIDDLRHMLTPGFDPCLEEYSGKVLRARRARPACRRRSHDSCGSSREIAPRCGAPEYSDAEPLKVLSVIKFGPNGEQLSLSVQFTLTIGEARTRDRAGNSKPEKPKRSIAQKRVKAAGKSLAATDSPIFRPGRTTGTTSTKPWKRRVA